ncbi:hypothetical protein [Halorarius halobius]|uniref:hypothetical protein n=1 Tax=Halorarius halobius TaxID=2962671 RepID=UPI0020CFBBBC|nr:hypothetical protein [Halorarius halobius]
MSPPSRRTLLSAVGAGLAATAGCLDTLGTTDDGTPRTDRSPRDSPTPDGTPDAGPSLALGETYETDDGRTIRVDDAAVHPSVVSVDYVSSTHYYERVAAAGAGQQYVVVSVTTEGFDLGADGRKQYDDPIDVPLSVAVGGDRHDGPIPVGRDDSADRDRVAIAVPVVDADDAAVVWAREDGPRPRWRLPDAAVERLAAAPAFEVESWSVPESVEYGTAFDASVTVANHGGRDGRFLATLGVKQGSLGVPEAAWQVAAGETRTVTRTIEPHYYEGSETVRVVVDSGGFREDATVEVTGGPTETGTARPTG